MSPSPGISACVLKAAGDGIGPTHAITASHPPVGVPVCGRASDAWLVRGCGWLPPSPHLPVWDSASTPAHKAVAQASPGSTGFTCLAASGCQRSQGVSTLVSGAVGLELSCRCVGATVPPDLNSDDGLRTHTSGLPGLQFRGLAPVEQKRRLPGVSVGTSRTWRDHGTVRGVPGLWLRGAPTVVCWSTGTTILT